MTPDKLAVVASSADVYVAASVARWDGVRRPGQSIVEEPGLRGLLSRAEDLRSRLLVTDDRAYDGLAGVLPDIRSGTVTVFAEAKRCSELLQGDPAWNCETATAMIRRELRSLPALPLPGNLTLQPVRRLAEDPPGGVPLDDALALAVRADPRISDPPTAIAAFLSSLPPSTRLLAAVDGEATVRATSGSSVFGAAASVFFVNTDPDWRGLGIGQAMTAAALRSAREAGAQYARLDATEAAVGIYSRLGFETVAPISRFSRNG